MRYEDFLANISEQDEFNIIQAQYDANSFGNFAISILFDNCLNLHVIQDRGIIEIELIKSNLFSKDYIPLGFAVDFLKGHDGLCGEYIFNSILSSQELLFESIGVLEFIVKNDLLETIARQWKIKNKTQT